MRGGGGGGGGGGASIVMADGKSGLTFRAEALKFSS